MSNMGFEPETTGCWFNMMIPKKVHLWGCGMDDRVTPVTWCTDTCEQEKEDLRLLFAKALQGRDKLRELPKPPKKPECTEGAAAGLHKPNIEVICHVPGHFYHLS